MGIYFHINQIFNEKFCILFWFFLRRDLQKKIDFSSEELNQYYLPAELLDDITTNTNNMKLELQQNPNKYKTKKKYLPQDNYLTELSEELNDALLNCVRHHHKLIEFSKMMDDFFQVFILMKSFQSTFQICNLTFTFIKVRFFNSHSQMWIIDFRLIYHFLSQFLYLFPLDAINIYPVPKSNSLCNFNDARFVSIMLFWWNIETTNITYWWCINADKLVFVRWFVSSSSVDYFIIFEQTDDVERLKVFRFRLPKVNRCT